MSSIGKSRLVWLRFWSAALLVPLSILLNGCDSSSSSTEGTSSGGISYSSSLIGSVTLPGGAVKNWFSISGVESGGGKVTEIVVDTTGGPIYIDSLSNSASTFFDFDYGANSIIGGYSAFYNFIWNAGGDSIGALIPVRHVSAGDFPTGDYTIALSNASSSDASVNVYLVKKTDPDFASGGITLNLFVYTVGGSNPVISSVEDAQAIKNYITNIFQQVGVTVNALNVEFRDDPNAVAQAGGSADDVSAFLDSASRGTAGRGDTGINCFLMPQLGGGLLGMDGAIPGPVSNTGPALRAWSRRPPASASHSPAIPRMRLTRRIFP